MRRGGYTIQTYHTCIVEGSEKLNVPDCGRPAGGRTIAQSHGEVEISCRSIDWRSIHLDTRNISGCCSEHDQHNSFRGNSPTKEYFKRLPKRGKCGGIIIVSERPQNTSNFPKPSTALISLILCWIHCRTFRFSPTEPEPLYECQDLDRRVGYLGRTMWCPAS